MRSWCNYFLFHECMLFIGKAHGFWMGVRMFALIFLRSSQIGGGGGVGGGVILEGQGQVILSYIIICILLNLKKLF